MPESEIDNLRGLLDKIDAGEVDKRILVEEAHKRIDKIAKKVGELKKEWLAAENRAEDLEEELHESYENGLPADTLYETEKNELLQGLHANLTLEELTNLVHIAKGSKKNWK